MQCGEPAESWKPDLEKERVEKERKEKEGGGGVDGNTKQEGSIHQSVI